MRKFIILAVLIVALLLLESYRESASFTVTHYVVKSTVFEGVKPLKIAFLSDQHEKIYGEGDEDLLNAISKEGVDVICVGGDVIVGADGARPELAADIVKEISAIAPVYLANGNHEERLRLIPEKYDDATYYERYTSELSKAGLKPLVNASEVFSWDGITISVTGAELPLEKYTKGKKSTLSYDEMAQIADLPEASYHILLPHMPDHLDTYTEWGADLVLAGHEHGGLVRLPFVGAVLSPEFQFFPAYSRGCFEKDGTSLVVSGGLGSHSIPIRLNNPAELVVVTICS